MSAKKHVRQQYNEVFYLVLISMAQSCVVQFFPLYLKHLNLAAFDVGLIRACQVWLSVLLLPVWFSLAKHLHSACWKRTFFCIFLILIINIYFCLTFMPLSNKLQNITHCRTNEISQSRKEIASTARSKDNYINHMLSSLHRTPNVPSEVNSTNVRNMSSLDSSGKHISDSNNHGNKNISHQNYSNNLEHIATEILKFSEGINETNLNLLPFGDNETTPKPYNLSRMAHNKSHFNYLNARINNSNVHQTNNLFSIKFHKNSSRHDTPSTELFSEEHSLSLSTESAYNFETNIKDNYDFNYSDFSIPNRSLDQQKTLNSKERIENILKSNTGYNDQKFPISSSKDKTSTQKTENTALKNSKSRIEYISERNKANDMLYYPHHHMKVTHHSPSLYHNINSDGKDRISSHATKSGYIEKSDSKFQLSDKSQETGKTDSYGTLNTNPGMIKFPNTKPSLKNQNTQDVVAEHKAEENSTEESEETRDWQILKTLLQKQRHRRSVISKKHHRMRKHHHLHAYHKSNKSDEHHDRKLNSFDQYSQSDNMDEKTLEEGRTIRNHGTIRRLMFVNESEEQNDNSSEVKKRHIPVALLNLKRRDFINIIIKSKIKNILSLTFGTILLVAVLVEIFSRAIIATSNQILIPDGKTGGSFQQQIIGYQRENSQQIWTLFTWGIFGCPVVALLVFFTECSYQPRAFILFSTLLIGMALLLALFFLQLPNTVWDWKMDYGEEIDHRRTPFLERFGNNISIFVAAFAMACNSEFILWYMDTLNGFPYNYQLLYCGYNGIGAVFQAIVKSWLLRKHMSASVRMQDFSNPDVDTTDGDGVRSIGPILLGLHFLAASLLQPAWSLMFLGVLQGCSTAFLVSARISWCWAAGYGLGCLVGGLVVSLQGADKLFWIMAGSLFVWSAMITLSRGLLKCIGNNDRDRTSYSQLMLLGEDSDKEDVMVEEEDDEEEEECNDDDWLERALKKDEQQEAQRRRIMSCPT